MEKHKSIHSLITEFRCDPDVQKVKVNSTLTKKYIRDDDECVGDDDKKREPGHAEVGRLVEVGISQLLENGTQKRVGQKIGKAFIICNQHEDPDYGEHRKEALKNAKMVFKEYFDFEVSFYNNYFAKTVAYYSALIEYFLKNGLPFAGCGTDLHKILLQFKRKAYFTSYFCTEYYAVCY